MEEYSEECLDTFLARQGPLFDEPVAGTREEAEAFLEDCLAQTAGSLDRRRKRFSRTALPRRPVRLTRCAGFSTNRGWMSPISTTGSWKSRPRYSLFRTEPI